MLETLNGIAIHYQIDGRESAPWVTFITGIANVSGLLVKVCQSRIVINQLGEHIDRLIFEEYKRRKMDHL